MIPLISFSKQEHGFKPTVSVSACYCQYQEKVLFLKRAESSSQANTWGVPAGKLEQNEEPLSAVIREVLEETGITLSEKNVSFIKTIHIRYPQNDFVYHMFYYKFPELPSICLNPNEHQESAWLSFDEVHKHPIMLGGLEAFEYYKQYISKYSKIMD